MFFGSPFLTVQLAGSHRFEGQIARPPVTHDWTRSPPSSAFQRANSSARETDASSQPPPLEFPVLLFHYLVGRSSNVPSPGPLVPVHLSRALRVISNCETAQKQSPFCPHAGHTRRLQVSSLALQDSMYPPHPYSFEAFALSGGSQFLPPPFLFSVCTQLVLVLLAPDIVLSLLTVFLPLFRIYPPLFSAEPKKDIPTTVKDRSAPPSSLPLQPLCCGKTFSNFWLSFDSFRSSSLLPTRECLPVCAGFLPLYFFLRYPFAFFPFHDGRLVLASNLFPCSFLFIPP